MTTENEPAPNETPAADETPLRSMLASANQPFGPAFFLSQLRGMVRDHCPTAGELPELYLHLKSGEVLSVCHVIGVAPSWVALAVPEKTHPARMLLEMIPYELIARVTIRGPGQDAAAMGFDVDRRPTIVMEPKQSAEGLLSMAASVTAGGGTEE